MTREMSLPPSHPLVPRPLLPRWTVPVVAVVVLAAAGVAGWVLWQWIDSLALADPEKKAAAQLDVVKVSASVAVAGGGLFALYLATRRQRTQELELEARHAELRHRQAELDQRDRTQDHAEQVAETNRLHSKRVADASEWDAISRRVTDLYSTSVGQLGSDHAAVRLGGMYALERLAQDNPPQRQTVVNVLCAYLRMPYAVPADEPPQRRLGRPRAPLRTSRDRPASATSSTPPRTDHQANLQEREVRLTAQRLLFSHLTPRFRGPDWIVHESPGFWADVDLDLAGATLIDFALAGCAARTFLATGARFVGTTSFAGAAFTGPVQFDKAAFAGPAHFDKATFTALADFSAATFAGDPVRPYDLDHSKPYGNSFIDVSFGGGARFDKVSFAGFTRFNEVRFTGPARFDGATFTDEVSFTGTTFGKPQLTSVLGYHSFLLAKFAGRTDFAKARFAECTWFTEATFDGLVGFDGALIEQDVLTRYSSMAARTNRLQGRRPVLWPPGWRPADEHITAEDLPGTWHTFERTEPGPDAN
ncbi:pentapeptide repeat-containing protein [Amycolatopsis sp. NPDC049159]|uniref:pentapeptide repeat-containing protein n=1 Tax=Amycolatopsis sp. NPDC049159 TaxID=3157210 RepID=UPI003401FD3D